jgi:hypothetical protein
MVVSRVLLRILALLLILAGVLLLREPAGAQTIPSTPTRVSVVIPGASRETSPDGVFTLASHPQPE